MTNLGVATPMAEALDELGVNLSDLRRIEPDAALGNGGLGRLAACFMDSMATLSIAAHGYGIRYDNGLFRQIIRGGWQQETPEDWLINGNPWEFVRPEYNYAIGFGGWVEMIQGDDETRPPRLASRRDGRSGRATTRRSWAGAAGTSIRCACGRRGRPTRSSSKPSTPAITSARFPKPCGRKRSPRFSTPATRRRPARNCGCRQEYFFASASLLDLIRRHIKQWGDVRTLGQHSAVQLNDTHPAIGIAELMRILVDLNKIEWDEAWSITQAVFSYTNHTLLPEALETWAVPLMERVLPRHMQIIYLINAAHLDGARRRGFVDQGLLASISMIDEQSGRRVRMGNLAFVGSHKINGVSALHTDLMRKTVFHALNAVYPGRITNKTNGITFRRWLIECNPGLADIIRSILGERALDDYGALKGLAAHADDPAVQEQVAAAHRTSKGALARTIADQVNQRVDLDAMFDVQVKRIHEYKRQLLNILETVARYNAIRANPTHRVRAPGQDLRRQGGCELHAGQAHHQARHRRRQGRQFRSDRARPFESGVSAQL